MTGLVRRASQPRTQPRRVVHTCSLSNRQLLLRGNTITRLFHNILPHRDETASVLGTRKPRFCLSRDARVHAGIGEGVGGTGLRCGSGVPSGSVQSGLTSLMLQAPRGGETGRLHSRVCAGEKAPTTPGRQRGGGGALRPSPPRMHVR